MARTAIEAIKLKDVNMAESNKLFTVLNDTANGGAVPFSGKDFKTLIILKGGAAKGTVTIKAGNAPWGANDLIVATEIGNYSMLTLDSASFKNIHGSDKGLVILKPSSADIGVMVVELP